MNKELQALDKYAKNLIIYLLVLALASLGIALFLVESDRAYLSIVISFGLCGSTTAALTSALDRYANGFESCDGYPFPPEAKGEKFNRRFATWLIVRPFLGVIVPPTFIYGIALFTDLNLTDKSETLGFTAFMLGLLAKSTLDLIKNLFKNVFRA